MVLVVAPDLVVVIVVVEVQPLMSPVAVLHFALPVYPLAHVHIESAVAPLHTYPVLVAQGVVGAIVHTFVVDKTALKNIFWLDCIDFVMVYVDAEAHIL